MHVIAARHECADQCAYHRRNTLCSIKSFSEHPRIGGDVVWKVKEHHPLVDEIIYPVSSVLRRLNTDTGCVQHVRAFIPPRGRYEPGLGRFGSETHLKITGRFCSSIAVSRLSCIKVADVGFCCRSAAVPNRPLPHRCSAGPCGSGMCFVAP